jgi:uncharacterized protein YbjT (DUF2867 family)
MTQRMKVLVTGGTGKQGGAILRRLREKGHAVRALTRSADSVAAKALVANGAEIAVGHLEDRASLDRALDGVDAMFLMSTAFEADTAAETRQGVTGANAAKDRHIYFVYTSVGSADRKTGIPHFESKYEVERHIEDVGARAAIIAPVYFMENAVTFYREQLKEGVYATPLAPGRKLAQIAVDDIAAAAVAALERPDQFAGKRYDLAGDDLTGSDAVAILSRVTGRPFSYFQVPMDVVRRNMGEDGVKMYEWFERVGYYTFDSATLRRDFPEIRWHSFEAWAGEQNWKTIFAK